MSAALESVERVAVALGPLCDKVVFVGGAVAELLVTDQAVPEPRPTVDVDCMIEVASRNEYHSIENQLRHMGYRNDTTDDPPIVCRWLINGIKVDVMPTLEGILGFTNRWYGEAMENAQEITLPGGKSVKIISALYFFATKTEAFIGRGKEDFFASHDFEDIVYLINGRAELVEEMTEAPLQLRQALGKKWSSYIRLPEFEEAVRAHVDAYESTPRSQIVLERIQAMFPK